MIEFKRRHNIRYRHHLLGPTFDHIIVKSKGGLATIDNGVCACNQCNSTRATINFDAFSVLIQSASDILIHATRPLKKVRKSANRKYHKHVQIEFHKNPQFI
jgi:hypothetical protein